MKGATMPEPAEPEQTVDHDDGRHCWLCRRWVGNPRDGYWTEDYWYQGEGGWRYCGQAHDVP